MRLMNQTSVLGRYLWVFRRIVGPDAARPVPRLHGGPAHPDGAAQRAALLHGRARARIPVLLAAGRRLGQALDPLRRRRCSTTSPRAAAATIPSWARGRAASSAASTASPPRTRKLIEFLVREHLTMSRIAQKEDLSDPDVIAAFAKRVGNERYLTALYLLTVADIRGTSPKVWNAWKGKLLEDLYRYTLRALGGRAPDADAEVEARKREALVQLALHAAALRGAQGAVGHAGRELLHAPRRRRHRLAHPPPVAPRGHRPSAIVRARRSPVGEGLQVLVYTPDQPDLFARICGYFDQAGFSILDAKIHTAQQRLRARHLPGGQPDAARPLPRADQPWSRPTWTRTIDEGGPLPPPSRGRVSRRVKSFPDHAARGPAARRKSPALAAQHLGQRPGRPAVLGRARAGAPPHQPAAGQGHHPGRAGGRHLPDRRRRSCSRTSAQIEIETELLEALAA